MEQSQALELLIKSQAEQIRQLTEANAKQAEQMTDLQQKIDKLLSQIAWFTRQFYGRKSEKLSRLDPNQLNLFETLEDEKKHLEEIEAERIEAEKQIDENISSRKKTRSNRKLLEGLPGASLLSEIMLGKYEYHLPFYRQVKQFHHLGVKIPSNTLSGWFKPTCELLTPLYKVLKEEVLNTDYIQVDETTLPVINKESHYAKKEYLWMVRAVMKKLVFFHYDDGSRSGDTAYSLLKSFDGYLQSDGYGAYNVFKENDQVCLVACMAHIRRYHNFN